TTPRWSAAARWRYSCRSPASEGPPGSRSADAAPGAVPCRCSRREYSSSSLRAESTPSSASSRSAEVRSASAIARSRSTRAIWRSTKVLLTSSRLTAIDSLAESSRAEASATARIRLLVSPDAAAGAGCAPATGAEIPAVAVPTTRAAARTARPAPCPGLVLLLLLSLRCARPVNCGRRAVVVRRDAWSGSTFHLPITAHRCGRPRDPHGGTRHRDGGDSVMPSPAPLESQSDSAEPIVPLSTVGHRQHIRNIRRQNTLL